MRSALNGIELATCFICWMLANGYSLLKLFESQTDILQNNPVSAKGLNDLQSGWSFLTRLKDVSDYEWSSWKYFIAISWPYFIVNFIASEAVRQTKLCKIQYWYITSSVIYIGLHMGYKQLLLVLAQPLLYASVVFTGGKKISIWAISILILLCYNSVKYRNFFWQFLDHENMFDEEVYLLLFSLPWIELRCISFCLDYVNQYKLTQETQTKLESFIALLSYVLYVPLLYTGPVVLYTEFEKSFIEPYEKLSIRLKRFVCDMFIFLFYTLVLDLTLHYMYFFAMQEDIKLIKMIPTLALCGGGLWMGIQFHVKYVIAYGITSAFGRLDNIETPPTPRCIARIHIYSQMWRYFDVGLYRFLVKYIYKPFLEVITTKLNLPQIFNKMSASLATFIFICMWHGTIKRIFIWSALNYLGITLEYISKAIYETQQYKWFKKSVLRTDAMETRFGAMMCMPLLAISAISNFYLFGGTKIGDLFFENLLYLNFLSWNSLLICLSLYSCCIVSMALQDVSSRTDVKRVLVKVE